MTDIDYTATQIAEVFPQEREVLSVKLAETVEAGQSAYQTTSGTFGLADANGAGKQQFRGIFMEGGSANQVVRLLKRGAIYGLGVSGLNCDAPLYLSDTAGDLADAAGTMTVVCGRVLGLTDGTKVAYIDAQWAQVWS